REWASLIQRCQHAHGPMIEAAGAWDLVRKGGWLELYRTRKALEERVAEANEDRGRFGIEFDVLDAARLRAREPWLAKDLISAIQWTQRWLVSEPGALVQACARNFVVQGGAMMQASVEVVLEEGGGGRILTSVGEVQADLVVVAMGAWPSRRLACV